MKIAVFGDSFAKHFLINRSSSLEKESWVEILKSKNFNITNFAEPGSCLYFSYERFIKNHEKYDKIIFCITDHARIYLPEHSSLKINIGNDTFTIRNVGTGTKFNEIELKNNYLVANAVNQYFKYIYNDEVASLFHNLMIEKIKTIRPDGLYLHNRLRKIYYFENEFYNLENNLGKNWNENYLDQRICHITDTNNIYLSNIIEQWLTKINYKIPDKLYTEPKEPFEKYFIKI